MNHVKKSQEEQEEVDMAKLQLHLRELEVKATFEQTETENRRLANQLSLVKRENRELQSVMDQQKKGHAADSGQFQRKQGELVHTKVHQLRRQYDDLRSGNDQKAEEILVMNEKLDELQHESEPILSDESPMTQKIRMLENRLDKSLIKHNEAMSIRRTYETIVKRLRDERVGFDNQLAAIEKTLKAKEHDFLELKNMQHDAHHAKEVKKAEVQQFKAAYAESRREKKKELEKRKKYVTDRMEAAKKQEQELKEKQKREDEQAKQRHEEEERQRSQKMQSTTELRTEEEEERLKEHAEQYRKIQEVTRAKKVEDVVAKFLAQEDMHTQLLNMKQDVEAKIESRREEIQKLREKLDQQKYSGSGALGSRRIVDEFETHLAEASAQLDKASKNYERMSHLYSGAKAGVEHLAEKLSGYRPEVGASSGGDEALEDTLKVCETKLQMLVDEAVGADDKMDELLNNTQMEMPNNNTRVKLKGDVEEDEDDRRADVPGDEGDEDLQSRDALKDMSRGAVERENKKKKRSRKRDEDA